MPRLRGGLTTRGWCLLAAGLATVLCAVLLDERDLLRVATFVMVAPLLATLVVGLTQVRLRATREPGPPRIPVGSDCQVQLVVRTSGWLSGRLLLEDGVPPALADPVLSNSVSGVSVSGVSVSGGWARFAVAHLPPDRPVQLRYPLQPRERGVHTLGPLVARITDPFGLAEYRRTLAGCSRLVVTPLVVPLIGMPAGGELGTGEAGAGQVGAGPGQDAVVVRTYRQGDDLRKVHWRTTARRDELMVRVEEWPWRGGATVLLDHRAAAHRGSGPTSSLEYAVSLAASVYVHLVQQHRQRVRLVTGDGLLRAGGADATDHTTGTGLDALAALHATQQPDLVCGPAMAGGQQVVAVLGAVGPQGVEQLLGHRPRGMRSHAVLLDVAAWATGRDDSPAVAPDPARAARLLVAAGWSVTVAQPDQSPSAVWARLCVSSRSKREALR